MTVYVLNLNQKSLGPGQQVSPANQAGSANPPTQTLQINLVGTGAVSCSVAYQGSNDGIAFQNIAPVITIASAASPQYANATFNDTWQYYQATVTAIAGTNAAVSTYMAC